MSKYWPQLQICLLTKSEPNAQNNLISETTSTEKSKKKSANLEDTIPASTNKANSGALVSAV